MNKSSEEKNTTKTAEQKDTKKTYVYSVGRRKRSVATVRLFPKGDGEIMINEKKYTEYFPTKLLQELVAMPIQTLGENMYNVTVKVKGGGVHGQAEAVRHGIARALVKLDQENRKSLKIKGFLTRDAREKERKKPGLKRARRAPQWSKR